MKNRKQRVELIIELIQTKVIGSQEELAKMLGDHGFYVTQATLSRDLKLLKTTKVPTDRGTYMYMLPDSNSIKDKMLASGQLDRESHNYRNEYVSLEFAGNIAVIKTRTGYASGIAYDIDMSRMSEFVGTVAGSDTVFAVMRDGVSRLDAVRAISRLLPVEKKLFNI